MKKIRIVLIVVVILILGFLMFSTKVFFDVKGFANKISNPISGEKKVELDGKEFTVLLMGIDTGDEGRVDQGRSDTMIVAKVNPDNNKTTLVSIPRDTYTNIIGKGTMDKINHAYAFGGPKMSKDSVANLLGINIDFYISINMKGLKDLVDSVGGVSVDNTLEFTENNFNFPIGNVNLDGEKALAYSRMRHQDPEGDYGRQKRQQQVIKAIMSKTFSVSNILSYKNTLNVLSNNLKTDLEFNDFVFIIKKYTSNFKNIDQDTLQGTGEMINGISYQRVSPTEIERINSILQ